MRDPNVLKLDEYTTLTIDLENVLLKKDIVKEYDIRTQIFPFNKIRTTNLIIQYSGFDLYMTVENIDGYVVELSCRFSDLKNWRPEHWEWCHRFMRIYGNWSLENKSCYRAEKDE